MIEKFRHLLPFSNLFSTKEPEELIDKKFQIMSQAALAREDKIQKLSIVNQFDYNDQFNTNGAVRDANSLKQSLGVGLTDDKPARIKEYRELAASPVIKSALIQICNEFIAKDEKTNEIVRLDVQDCPDETVNKIKEEFKSFLIQTFDLEKHGWRDSWNFLTEGELFFENIISVEKPELGILGLTKIDAARIEPIYFDVENELLDHYQLRQKMRTTGNNGQSNQYQQSSNITSNLILSKNQITYVSTIDWDVQKRFRVPLIENVRMSHRKHNFVEDAAVIYMITRAPERLVFGIPVGATDPNKQDRIMTSAIARLTHKKTLGWDGRVENTYDPQHITENFYIPVPSGGAPQPSITALAGGSQISNVMEVLTYFQKELYKNLQIPISRLDSSTTYSDGTDITREELTFSYFVERLQKIYADAIKKTFIIHLKLKNKKLNLFESLKISDRSKEDFWDRYDAIQEAFDKMKREVLAENFQKLRDIQLDLDELKLREHSLLEEGCENDLQKMLIEEDRKLLREEALDIKKHIDVIKSDGKSMWETFELKEENIKMRFNLGNSFQQLRSQQRFQILVDNLSNLSQNPLMSFTYLLKTILEWSDHQILANAGWRIKDAERTWEISQIEQSGPDFRKTSGGQGASGGGGGPSPDGPGMPSGGGGGGAGDDTKLADLQPPGGASAETPPPPTDGPLATPAPNGMISQG